MPNAPTSADPAAGDGDRRDSGDAALAGDSENAGLAEGNANTEAVSGGRWDADPTAVLAAHWNESERRLYPTATTNPDAYQSAVKLVRAVADALAPVCDLAVLVERWEHRSAILDEAAGAAGVSVAPGLAEATAGCGFAVRRRELLAERAERRRRQSIAAAREAGRVWAIIHEQGDLAAGLADPYQRMELHLRTGLAVVSMVEPDPSTMTPLYVVTVTETGESAGASEVDATSKAAGGVGGDPPGESAGAPEVDATRFEDLETADPARFEDNRQTMRDRVEAFGA